MARVRAQQRGETPLHIASWEGHEAVVRMLLDRGASINALMTVCCSVHASAAEWMDSAVRCEPRWQGGGRATAARAPSERRARDTCAFGVWAISAARLHGASHRELEGIRDRGASAARARGKSRSTDESASFRVTECGRTAALRCISRPRGAPRPLYACCSCMVRTRSRGTTCVADRALSAAEQRDGAAHRELAWQRESGKLAARIRC